MIGIASKKQWITNGNDEIVLERISLAERKICNDVALPKEIELPLKVDLFQSVT